MGVRVIVVVGGGGWLVCGCVLLTLRGFIDADVVRAQEQVEAPGGTSQAWRILLRNGRAVRTAWISLDTPHRIMRWDNGETIFELVKAE